MATVTDEASTGAVHLEPRRDGWGRPLLVTPGGDRRPYTRVTTVADTCDERRALERWLQREAVRGVALRSDLYALAVAAGDDKSKLDAVVAKATEAAASTAKANLGTALHALTEKLDRGEDVEVPAPFDADLDAYRRATAGIEWLAIERLAVLDAHLVAGTPDRIGRLPDGRLVVADLKTGVELSYSWRSISVQLAAYAHGEAFYDPGDDSRHPFLPVDQAEALVIHLPAGKASCELLSVDIAAGWQAFALALEVRAWRQRRDLSRAFSLRSAIGARSNLAPTTPAPAEEGELVKLELVEALRDQVRGLRPAARTTLGQLVAEAVEAGVDFRPSVRGTARRVAIHQAAVSVADVLDGDDDVTRSAVALVCGAEPQAVFPLGAVLGSLTAAEALRLHGLLVELGVGQRRLVLEADGATFPPYES